MEAEVSRFVDNQGLRLHVVDSGGGSDRAPIVFIPGMADLAMDYVAMLPTLGRRTVVIDLRGHGRSGSPAQGYGFEQQVSDISAVVDDLTAGPIHLMTFSRGTCYALGWAAENANRVLSVSIGDYPAREIALPHDGAASFRAGRWRGTQVADRLSRVAGSGTFTDAVDRPLWHVLSDLEVPVLVVRSSAGAPLNDDDWKRYAMEVPQSRRMEFHDSPHDIFRPDRLRFASLVRENVEAASPPV